jgi:hypothetical protein
VSHELEDRGFRRHPIRDDRVQGAPIPMIAQPPKRTAKTKTRLAAGLASFGAGRLRTII